MGNKTDKIPFVRRERAQVSFLKNFSIVLKYRHILQGDLMQWIELHCFQKEWRAKNPHNGTTAVNIFPMEKVIVGGVTYGPLYILTWDNPSERLEIGNFCSIAGNVTFLLGGEHNPCLLSTFPLWTHVWGHEPEGKTTSKGPIIVEDDVWIGYGATILSGVTIGKGAVIGAGSVVARDIEPYSIYAGGKIIKKRFPDNIIKKLMNADLKGLQMIIDESLQHLIVTENLTSENIDTFLSELERSYE